MLGLLILILVAAVLVWLAATYLPAPINWIVALVIIILAVVAVFGGGVVDAVITAPPPAPWRHGVVFAKFWG